MVTEFQEIHLNQDSRLTVWPYLKTLWAARDFSRNSLWEGEVIGKPQ